MKKEQFDIIMKELADIKQQLAILQAQSNGPVVFGPGIPSISEPGIPTCPTFIPADTPF